MKAKVSQSKKTKKNQDCVRVHMYIPFPLFLTLGKNLDKMFFSWCIRYFIYLTWFYSLKAIVYSLDFVLWQMPLPPPLERDPPDVEQPLWEDYQRMWPRKSLGRLLQTLEWLSVSGRGRKISATFDMNLRKAWTDLYFYQVITNIK